jgi:Ca2+-binding RTX toxin-like protein
MATPSAFPLALSGENIIDATTHGYYWLLGPDRTIHWSLSMGWNGESWSNPTALASTLQSAFNTYSYYANIKFQYVGYFTSPLEAALSSSDINVASDQVGQFFNSYSAWAFGNFPRYSYNSLYYGAPGDIYINGLSQAAYLPDYSPGSAGFFLFLHEIGHTLGLKHPHDDGGTGRPTYASLGWGNFDDDWFSVMSYKDDADWNLTEWDPASPMLIDVIAMQYLYGKNMLTNAGDNTLTLKLTNMYETYWDASGNDSIDASGSTVGWSIILPDLQMSSLVDTKVGFATPRSGLTSSVLQTLYWLAGDYENVYGSAYADYITGSSASNVLAGNGGDDTIMGGGGDDTFQGIRGHDIIFGGTGSDVLEFGKSNTLVPTVYKLRENSFYFRDTAGNTALCRDVEKFLVTEGTYYANLFSPMAKINSSLIQIYVAAFKRAPELGGYNYWSTAEHTSGLEAVARTIFSLDIVKTIYPVQMTNAAFVTAIYNNVFNKQPDTEGLQYWSNQLAAKSRGELVINMTSAAINVADGVDGKDYFQNRVDWAIYAAAKQSIQNFESPVSTLLSATATVDADPQTVVKLIGQWDGVPYL